MFKLPYMEMLRRCEEAERNMQFILKQCETFDIPVSKCRTVAQLTELTQAMAEERKTVSHFEAGYLSPTTTAS